MKSAIILAIVAAVLVSGCTNMPDLGDLGGTGALGSGSGLEIVSFTAEPATIFSGASTRLLLEAQNMGGTSVPDGNSMVFLTGSNFDAWASTTTGSKYAHLGEMKAEDVVRGIPANTKRLTWTMSAPSITAGQTRTDTFIARIYDEYKTSANGNVWVYNETEADAAKAAGRPLYTSSFTYTKGPVGLSISVSPEPIVLYAGENSFTMSIKISNLASGTIYKTGGVTYTANSENTAISTDELNNVSLSITSTGLGSDSDCTGYKDLIAGKDTTVFCTFTLNSGTTVDTFKSFPINMTVSYGYYTERTASVVVQGK
jgi:hypothetical protein